MSWTLKETFKCQKGAANYPSGGRAQAAFLHLAIATAGRMSEKTLTFSAEIDREQRNGS
jgi:hypothetical protein